MGQFASVESKKKLTCEVEWKTNNSKKIDSLLKIVNTTGSKRLLKSYILEEIDDIKISVLYMTNIKKKDNKLVSRYTIFIKKNDKKLSLRNIQNEISLNISHNILGSGYPLNDKYGSLKIKKIKCIK